jgi:choline-sulfatase
VRRRPNVIVFMSDDQGAWAQGCAGNVDVSSPAQDRLAAEGTRFSSFFCASPVCSPARATFLTGRIPSQHGVLDWIRVGNLEDPGGKWAWSREPDRAIEYLKGTPGYTDYLAREGYTCALSGKWHLGDSTRPQKGFTWWYPHAWGGGPYYGAPMIRGGTPYQESRYVTDAITEGALEFLSSPAAAGGEGDPFYLHVCYTAPHSPWDRDNHPRELYDSYRSGCAFTATPEEPPHPWQAPTAPQGTGEARKDLLAGYYAAITGMDLGIARILDRVQAMGIREETLVIFTSDNGMNMGHHGIWGKGNGTFPLNMYDTSVKVPFIASLPGTIPEGRICDQLIGQYDWMPTLLDLLGVDVPGLDRLPGRSFASLLLGKESSGDEAVLVYDEYGPVRMVRTRDWKYVHRYPYGPHELYRLSTDPDERANLYEGRGELPEASRKAVELKATLDKWFARYADPARDGSREGVTGFGQVDLAGPAGGGRNAWYPGARIVPTLDRGGSGSPGSPK